jgi:cytochrome bd-type quinol oxidase subunit 2
MKREGIMNIIMKLNKIFEKSKLGVLVAVVSLVFLGLAITPAKVGAQTTNTINKSTCEGISIATGGGDAGDCKDDGNASFSSIIRKVISILSILVGAVSVIMLIIGGFRYIISNGDSNSTKSAKDTIMYALIGLIIVLFAQIIVRFVWTNATDSGNGGGGGTSTP